MEKQEQTFIIPAGLNFCEVNLDTGYNKVISHLCIISGIIAGNKKLKIYQKYDSVDSYFPVFDSAKNIDAIITLVEQKSISFNPFILGTNQLKFELDAIQTQDITVALKFTYR